MHVSKMMCQTDYGQGEESFPYESFSEADGQFVNVILKKYSKNRKRLQNIDNFCMNKQFLKITIYRSTHSPLLKNAS